MNRMEECPFCEGKLIHGTNKVEFKYKDKTFLVDMISEYCAECDEGFQDDEDLKINSIAIEKAKTEAINLK